MLKDNKVDVLQRPKFLQEIFCLGDVGYPHQSKHPVDAQSKEPHQKVSNPERIARLIRHSATTKNRLSLFTFVLCVDEKDVLAKDLHLVAWKLIPNSPIFQCFKVVFNRSLHRHAFCYFLDVSFWTVDFGLRKSVFPHVGVRIVTEAREYDSTNPSQLFELFNSVRLVLATTMQQKSPVLPLDDGAVRLVVPIRDLPDVCRHLLKIGVPTVFPAESEFLGNGVRKDECEDEQAEVNTEAEFLKQAEPCPCF
mmetsp:Transcript_4585/g.8951  ORF Transcript_4585/g.8951 Transcript_4585/m.8951 type:complete len:251 (+) Transcript_4585:315-1067(+)